MLVSVLRRAPSGPSPLLRWATRLGALGSAYFVVVMLAMGSFCPWCAATHTGSFVLWWFVARSDSRQAPRRPMSHGIGGVAAAILVTIALGILEYRHADALTRASRADEAAMARSIAEAHRGSAARPAPEPADAPAGAGTPEVPAAPPPAQNPLLGRRTIGPAAAPIQIVVFSDYQCPDCRRIDAEVETIVARGDVAVTARHFPLCADCNRLVPRAIHPDACRRAMLAEAAGDLGGAEAFAKAHHALFALQDESSNPPTDPVDAVLASTGLDRSALLERMTSDAVRAAILRDIDDAVTLGVTFTPMVFVNGHEWKWYRSREPLSVLVDRVATAALATVAPPSAVERLVDDWRAGRELMAFDAGSDAGPDAGSDAGSDAASDPAQGTTIIAPPPGPDGTPPNVPDVRIWVDYAVPATALLDRALTELAAEGVAFRLTVSQFPASSSCNTMAGLGLGKPESCLGALVAAAAGIVGGDAGFGLAHRWLVDHADAISLEAIAPAFDALPEGRAAVLAAFGDGRAMELVKRQTEQLMKRARVQSLPTVIVDGKLVPRWEHPGAPGKEILRAVLTEAASNRAAAAR